MMWLPLSMALYVFAEGQVALFVASVASLCAYPFQYFLDGIQY